MVISAHLDVHCWWGGVSRPFLAGPWIGHSIEIELIGLLDVSWRSQEEESDFIDVSAVFDTTDPSILLDLLWQAVGTMLLWFSTFLHGWYQSVLIRGERLHEISVISHLATGQYTFIPPIWCLLEAASSELYIISKLMVLSYTLHNWTSQVMLFKWYHSAWTIWMVNSLQLNLLQNIMDVCVFNNMWERIILNCINKLVHWD